MTLVFSLTPSDGTAEGERRILIKEYSERRPPEIADDGTAVSEDALGLATSRSTSRAKLVVPGGADYVKPALQNPMARPNFWVLQAWEGTVEEVAIDSFRARLRDLTELSRPDEIVEIFSEEVDAADRDLLRPGGVFYWNIGYKEGSGIPRERTSRVTFRRVPRVLARCVPSLSVGEIQAALA